MNWLPEHKCGLYLTHNDHKDMYELIQDCYEPKDFISPEEYEKSIREDSVWTLEWYQETPVGRHVMRASSLEAIRTAIEQEYGIGDDK